MMENKQITKKEAKWYSDLSTFETGEFRKYIAKNFKGEYPKELSKTGIAFFRVLQENYVRWRVDETKETKQPEQKNSSNDNELDIKTYKDYRNLRKDKNFLVDGFLYPKCVVMVYSPPANFKSLLIQQMGMAISTGRKFMGLKTKKNAVLYCDGENAEMIIKERLDCFYKGMNLKRHSFPFYILKNGLLMDERKNIHIGFVAALEQAIEKYGIKVLIFDTLHRFAYYDENKSDDINKVYTGIFKPLIEKYGISIVFLHHSRKDGGYRGSGDFLGMVDVAYRIWRNGKTNKFKIFNEKCRSGEIPDISGEIDFGEDYYKIVRLNDEEEQEQKLGKLKEATAKIREMFKQGVELRKKDILDRFEIEEYDCSPKTIQRSLKFLVDNNYLDKSSKGVYILR